MGRAGPFPALIAALAICGPARALDLTLPSNARQTADRVTVPDSYALPLGPYEAGELPVRQVEGRVTRRAWQIPARGATTLQLFAPLRAQLVEAGYEPIFECADRACGGFDFRYALDILEAPAMHVDLFDYRVLSARRGQGAEAAYVSVLVSRTSSAGYVQVVHVAPEEAEGVTVTREVTADAPPGPQAPFAERLEGQGHAILSDLDFAVGSSDLSEGSYDSLQTLADYLAQHPDRRVALVGHTDTEGALEGNIALSRRRAQSVLERLVSEHGVPRAQLDAEGMGYLAPVATNLTEEGREANRRVEAVLLTAP